MQYTETDKLKLCTTHNVMNSNYGIHTAINSLRIIPFRSGIQEPTCTNRSFPLRYTKQDKIRHHINAGTYNQSLNHFISYFFVDQEITSIRIYHILLRFNTRNNAYLLKDTGIISSQSC